MKNRCRLVAFVALLALASTASAATTNQVQRWIYLHTYLNNASMFQFATNLLNRAGAAGYTGVVLADTMLETTNGGTASYNSTYLQPFLNQASNLGINVVPLVFSFGHSESSIVSVDKNLAEPQPVIGAGFTVSADKQSLLFSNSLAGMVNTNFDTHSGNSFTVSGWGFQDGAGIRTFADTTNFHGGGCSLRIDPDTTGTNKLARIIYRFNVQPWRQYHVRVWMQMTNFSTTGMLDVQFLGNPSGQACNYTGDNGPFTTNGVYPANQGWTQYDYVCNSATNNSINMAVGLWNNSTGHLWIDDVSVEEVALVNLVRRTGASLRIYDAANTNLVYSEPADVNTVSDPAISSGGPFNAWHTPPSVTLPAGTSLAAGQQVKMDYYAVNPVNVKQVGACLTAPGIAGYMSSNIVGVAGRFPANVGFYLDIDELRHLNTCATCTAMGQTAGGLLAWHLGQCVSAIRSVRPNAPIYLCSDMYDPYHNAISNQYYFAGGPVAGSWTGVTSELIVMNWNHPNNVVNTNSLNFFASRGNKQFILGYYDTGNGTMSASNELKAAQGVAGFQGLVYTSWLNNQTNGFAQLENYAAAAKAPTLTAGPANLTVNPGQLATFNASAAAPTPMTYQWQRNAADIAGATNASYSFTTVAGDNGAQFACHVSDYGGWVLTDPATLTVNQPPTLTTVVSRKVHGSAGTFDLNLNLDPLANPTVEPRSGGPTQLIFTFNKNVAAADGTLSANEFTLTNATYSSSSISASNLTLNLTSVPDQSKVMVVLNGISDLAGNALAGTNAVRIRALYGDINQSGTVTIGDMQAAKNNLGRTLTTTNFLCDVNLSGGITIGDMQAGKNMLSHTVSLSSFGSGISTLQLSAMSAVALPAATLGEALGAPSLVWGTNGDEVWSPTIAPDGSSAAWSGSIGDLNVSWVETMVTGPGTVSFEWKVSSELNGDYLTFSVDGVNQPGRISGEAGWQSVAFSIPTGARRLTWTYAKNRANAAGLDAGWLRRVSYQRSP